MTSTSWLQKFEESTELFQNAKERWPKSRSGEAPGKWILGSFDDESIVVYQAYNQQIASYAAEHGHFVGCPNYNQQRMTWIKTNFLWMMYRSSWATAPNQERILAIWLRRTAFDKYLADAVHSSKEFQEEDKDLKRNSDGSLIRLQWDPDHHPHGQSVPGRRAIQLGLKKVQSFLDGQDILRIVDITPFVQTQYQTAVVPTNQLDLLRVPIEHLYIPEDEQIRQHIRLDSPPVEIQ